MKKNSLLKQLLPLYHVRRKNSRTAQLGWRGYVTVDPLQAYARIEKQPDGTWLDVGDYFACLNAMYGIGYTLCGRCNGSLQMAIDKLTVYEFLELVVEIVQNVPERTSGAVKDYLNRTYSEATFEVFKTNQPVTLQAARELMNKGELNNERK